MTLWEIFRFEVTYQGRRVSTWLYFAILLSLTLYLTSELSADYARNTATFSNAPFVIALMSLLWSTIGLFIAGALAGDAAARDVQTRLDSLLFTAPISKAAYLGGRFLAAFGLFAIILLAVPLGLLLAERIGSEADLLGPFRPAAYLGAYLILLLPNAFLATAVLFSLAVLSRRATLSYLGGLLLLGASAFSWGFVARKSGQWELAKILDPLGATVLGELSMVWTPLERSTKAIALEHSLLSNRLLWIGLALGVLTLTYARFRFAYHSAGTVPSRGARRTDRDAPRNAATVAVLPPHVQRTFGFTTHCYQILAVARDSFQAVVKGWGGLVLAATAAFLVFSVTPIAHMGVPLVATTERMTALLASRLTSPQEINWIVVPLLIAFYAGELIWREGDARLSEITDAAPVPDWVRFTGQCAGLGLVLVALQALMIAAGMVTQALLGHYMFRIEVYANTLFGFQLADYLLFALLALIVHTLANHKYLGHLLLVLAYAFMTFGQALGVEHKLLVYGSDPGWTYSDMRGFEPFVGPWVWFKLYWTAWALLLAMASTLFRVRGTEAGMRSRFGLAHRRLTRRTAGGATAALAILLIVAGFIFYNTNVLNAYDTDSRGRGRRAEYERRYGRYKDIPQPQLTGVMLNVEIYPGRRQVEIRGTFHLRNTSTLAIDAIHLASKPGVATSAFRFDRPAKQALSDEVLGHRIYALEALQPGESVRLDFEVHFNPHGFTNRGIDPSVVANGTHFTNEWLPGIGYQAERELRSAGERRASGLAARPAMPALDDQHARGDGRGAARIAFEAVVGTDEGQVAVAPGRLHRTWTQDGRRYFHYATDSAIRNDYAFFSAAYAVHEARWNDVAIQVVHHPTHAWNVQRMVRSVQSSLDHYTRRFGPYPHGQLRLVEHPGDGISLHASPINISYEEAFSLLNPAGDSRDIDFPFAVVAHEVAHQWWGNTLVPAPVEGAALLTESLAWYSALEVVERTFGREHLERLLDMMRQVYLTPRARADVPLLRAADWFNAYRKGPFVMYALREYVGANQVNAALRRLLARHGSGVPPLPTSRDLYHELQAVTPASLRYLLVDLLEANTFWELAIPQATAEQTATGDWQVTLDVQARKVVVDTAGVETEVSMDDLIEIAVFTGAQGKEPGKELYLQPVRVRSGKQHITVVVPSRPATAGIDPRQLLIDVNRDDNLREITSADDPPAGRRPSM